MTTTAVQRKNIARIERERQKPRAGWSKIIDWSEGKRIRGRVSCALIDEDGRRCLSPARWRYAVHGNPEFDTNWYAVPLCRQHYEAAS